MKQLGITRCYGAVAWTTGGSARGDTACEKKMHPGAVLWVVRLGVDPGADEGFPTDVQHEHKAFV